MTYPKLYPVILEFCGGDATDSLYEHLAMWNPKYSISVLDNCSPHNCSRYVTHRNTVNAYIGGGIRSCIKLAEEAGSRYLLFIANDVEPVTVLRIDHLEEMIESDTNIVQLGVSLTLDSDKISYYPWMANHGKAENRVVPHCDLLCCILRLDFVRDFGGFPDSKSGWGYDLEIAYHANVREKRILIADEYTVRHAGDTARSDFALGKRFNKLKELKEIYAPRYGDFEHLMSRLLLPYRVDEGMSEYHMGEGITRQLSCLR